MPTRTTNAPSIRVVAREAGVSAQTVSRVANGHPRVRPETRARVEETMTRLGYVPNRAARLLRNGSSHTIGVMAQRFERTGEALIVEAVVQAAERHGYSVTLSTVTGSLAHDWQRTSSQLTDQGIDALVIIRNEKATPETLDLPPGLPVAVADSRLAGALPAVVCDQTGTRDVVNHLLELGHHTVHHLAGPDSSEPAQQRLNAWREVLQGAARPVPEPLRGDWSAASGFAAGQQLAQDPEVTAVFCANDEMAFGAMRALHEHGLRVPDEVSIAGVDDIALAAYAVVPLTTVQQDFRRIGTELVHMVLGQLAEGRPDPSDRVVLPTRLVVRSSTAAPGRGSLRPATA